MKPAALEAQKEQTTRDIEFNLDALLAAMGISYTSETPPVRNPNYRQLQSLERINEKLALVLVANDVSPVHETRAAVLSDPEPEAAQVPDKPVDEDPKPEAAVEVLETPESKITVDADPEAAQPAEAGTPESVNVPDKKNKKSK